jgi:hypothetical protein
MKKTQFAPLEQSLISNASIVGDWAGELGEIQKLTRAQEGIKHMRALVAERRMR